MAVLYIQMELCGIDLRKYLDRRNVKITDQLQENGDPFAIIDTKLECDYFLQILKGVEYIHSKQMIHRDLKPQNILFSLDNSRIKIGDFGLATLHSSTNFKPGKNNHGFVGHTRSLGTEVYAAPEQRNSYNYDYRVDMYSLGLILFEMFHPFSTNMERGKLVDKLKSLQGIPKDMDSRWPKLCALILKLTSKNPDDRPRTITDVISLFREAFPNILLLKPNLSRKEIESLIQENLKLKMLLAEKDEHIEKLKQTLENCSPCSGSVK